MSYVSKILKNGGRGYRPEIIAVISALLTGLFSHLFALTNVLQNYDNIWGYIWGLGATVSSGRWFLQVLGDFVETWWGWVNLAWLHGVTTILILALAAGLVASALHLERKRSAALLGMIFICFPAVTNALFFRFTCVYYAIAVFLAVLAVWVLDRYRLGVLFSAVCSMLSLALYQAYFPLTAGLAVVLLLQMTLREGVSFAQIFKKACYYFGALVLGLITYLVSVKISLYCCDTALDTYQGIAGMGQLSAGTLLAAIKDAYVLFLKLPLDDYCGVATSEVVRVSIVLLGVFSVAAIAVIQVRRGQKKSVALATVAVFLVFPLAANLIEVMSPKAVVYTLMVYGVVTMYFIPIILAEELRLVTAALRSEKLRRGAAILLSVVHILLFAVAMNYTYWNNANYTALYYTTEQTKNYLNALVVQVRMTEGYQASQKWAFIGSRVNDPLRNNASRWLMTYGRDSHDLVNAYSRNKWLEAYFGYSIPLADQTTIDALSQTESVQQMPCFPNEGSIRIIGNVVVIKLEEVAK